MALVHSTQLYTTAEQSQGCPGCPTVSVSRVFVYPVQHKEQEEPNSGIPRFSPARWRTEDANPTQDVVSRGPAAPTKTTSVMATRAKNRASLALPLPCNAVDEASKLSPNDHGHVSFQFHATPPPPLQSGVAPLLIDVLGAHPWTPIPR